VIKVREWLLGEVRDEERAVLIHAAAIPAQVQDQRPSATVAQSTERAIKRRRKALSVERPNAKTRNPVVSEELEGDVAWRATEPSDVLCKHRVHRIGDSEPVALTQARNDCGDTSTSVVARNNCVAITLCDKEPKQLR